MKRSLQSQLVSTLHVGERTSPQSLIPNPPIPILQSFPETRGLRFHVTTLLINRRLGGFGGCGRL